MIKIKGCEFKSFNFPTGEKHVTLYNFISNYFEHDIEFIWEKNEDIIELLLIIDALKQAGHFLRHLKIPYVPFSRQDRICNEGEPLSIKVFTDLINSLNAKKVIIYDPHSDVTPALINNCIIIPQDKIFPDEIFNINIKEKEKVFISPDAGSLKKIHKLGQRFGTPVLECSKVRNTLNGNIIDIKVPNDVKDKVCYIIDDICDGGKTFVEIAKKLKEYGAYKIILCVTHGFFTKGLQVFDGLIDEIHTYKGKVK